MVLTIRVLKGADNYKANTVVYHVNINAFKVNVVVVLIQSKFLDFLYKLLHSASLWNTLYSHVFFLEDLNDRKIIVHVSNPLKGHA